MLAREYVIVVEAADGRAHQELCRTATTGHPAAGEEVIIDGAAYEVTRVRHQDDPDAPTERVYTVAWVFVRPLGAPATPWPTPPSGPASAPWAPRVLPFALPAPGGDGQVESAILPATLVALLVACGYREQASRYRAARRVTARLRRDGHGWIVDEVAPAAWWQASRRAKHAFTAAAGLLAGARLSGSCAPALPNRPSPAPSPRAARPALRLA
jgi:hypothetical protein